MKGATAIARICRTQFEQQFYVETDPVFIAHLYRWFLSIWTILFFFPRFQHLDEIYGRTVLRSAVPVWRLIGDPVLPEWLLQILFVSLCCACIAFALGFWARYLHVLILIVLSILFAQDMLMPRAYGVLAYIQWFFLFLAPYDHRVISKNQISLSPKWRLFFLRLQFSSVYVLTVPAKVLGGDGWLTGDTLYTILNSPRYGLWLLSSWGISLQVAWFLSIATLIGEWFIGFGIWHRVTRGPAIACCILFHVAMSCTLRVSILFHLLMIGHVVLFLSQSDWLKGQDLRQRIKGSQPASAQSVVIEKQ
jgi:hypothetical protein